jgi:1,4-alpha-glucan branching enzyme
VLKRQPIVRDRVTKVTFALPLVEIPQAVSVVGDFNDWDPLAHPLKKRSNGTRSVTVDLPAGGTYRFKYLAEDGRWFCDPGADGEEPNEFSQMNSLLHV